MESFRALKFSNEEWVLDFKVRKSSNLKNVRALKLSDLDRVGDIFKEHTK
jgi:hypothetical protein